MKKKETLAHWESLTPNQPILPHMTVIPYKAAGSSYGACGIRIDGNPAFIDAVLSRLQDLLAGENVLTRLGLARNVVDGSKLGKTFAKADTDAEVCYIRLHERGSEGAMLQAYCSKKARERLEQYDDACGRPTVTSGQAARALFA